MSERWLKVFGVIVLFAASSVVADESPRPPPPSTPPVTTAAPAPVAATPAVTPTPAPPLAPNGAAAPATPAPAQAGTGFAEIESFLEPFLYDPNNRRDPFVAFAEFATSEDSAPSRALSPAQRWELDKLKLIGIMWDVKDPKAMFLDPSQEVMILGRDESIGNRNGYIAAVREGEVLVVESVRKRGDLVYQTKVLRIER